jgi:hypothetical protein
MQLAKKQATNLTWSDSTATSDFQNCPVIHCVTASYRRQLFFASCIPIIASNYNTFWYGGYFVPPRSIALSRINNDKPTEQNSLKSHSVVMSRQQSIGQIGRTTEQDYRDSHFVFCFVCLRPVSCVTGVVSVSGLSIRNRSFGFL